MWAVCICEHWLYYWYDVHEIHCRRQARKVLWNQPGQPTRTPCTRSMLLYVIYIYILLCLYFICFISSLPYNLVQESQGNTSEFTSKLAAYTLGNESRDFFRNNPLPLEPWQGVGPIFLSILSIIFENRRLGGSMILKLQHLCDNCVVFRFGITWDCKEPWYVKVPVKLSDGSEREASLPLHLPYDIVKYLICDCGLWLDDDLVSNYWSHLELVKDNLAVATQEFRNAAGRVWPIGFYGDEAAMGLIHAPTNQIYGLFTNLPLFRPKSTRLSRFLLFSVESENILSMEATLFPVLELITESFNKLIRFGCNGIRFLLTEIRGDQAFFRNIFKHKSWWTCTNMCFRCRAVAGPGHLNYCVFHDVGSNDGWMSTLRSTEEFLVEELPAQNPCSLVNHIKLVSWIFCWYSVGNVLSCLTT